MQSTLQNLHSPAVATALPAEPPASAVRLVPEADYRYVLEGFRRLLPVGSGIERHLRGVLADTLAHPGSLVRAQLAFSVLRRGGVESEAALALAVGIEYFHTASLLFDDLPSMDDAAERRGRPCPHTVYGEAAAQLGALALVNQGYALLWRALGPLPAARREAASRLVVRCLGVEGILDGQARDLHYGTPGGGRGAEEVLAVAEGKTASLIRLTLVLPAIVAGAGGEAVDRLDRLAVVWGLAYQIVDDFKDRLMSRSETGKTPRRDHLLNRPNLPGASGPGPALARLADLLAEGRALVASFAAAPGGAAWKVLERLQELLEDEGEAIRARRILANCA